MPIKISCEYFNELVKWIGISVYFISMGTISHFIRMHLQGKSSDACVLILISRPASELVFIIHKHRPSNMTFWCLLRFTSVHIWPKHCMSACVIIRSYSLINYSWTLQVIILTYKNMTGSFKALKLSWKAAFNMKNYCF